MVNDGQKALFSAFMRMNHNFRSSYGSLWVRPDPVEEERLAQDWLEALVAARITPRTLNMVCRLIETDPRFSPYPPKRHAFIAAAKSLQSMDGLGADLVLFRRVFRLFLDFSVRYGTFWPRRSLDEEVVAAGSWASSLAELGVSVQTIDAAAGRLDKMSDYSSRPPTMSQFRRLCLEAGLDGARQPPPPEVAYRQACGQGEQALHPAVLAARQSVGAYRLRTVSAERTRGEFMKAYERSVNEHLLNPDAAPGSHGGDNFAEGGRTEPDEPVDSDEMLQILDALLATHA